MGNNTDRKKSKDKARRNLQRLLSLILLLIITIVVFNRQAIYFKAMTSLGLAKFHMQQEDSMQSQYSLQMSEYKGAYLVLADKSLILKNREGALKWRKTVEFENPGIFTAKGIGGVFDRKSGVVRIYGTDGRELSSYDGSGPIENIEVIDDTFVMFQKNENRMIITDAMFSNLVNIKPLNGDIVKYYLDTENIYIAVKGESSFINKYDLAGNLTSFMEFKGESIEDLYKASGKLIMISSSRIAALNDSLEVVKEVKLDFSYNKLSTSADKTYFVAGTQEASDIRTFLNEKFEFAKAVSFQGYADNVVYTKYGTLIYRGGEVFIVNGKGKIKAQMNYEFEISNVIVVDDVVYISGSKDFRKIRIIG